MSKLAEARRDVANVNRELGDLNTAQRAAESSVATAQAALASINLRAATQQAKLAQSERDLGEAEQSALDRFCVELAAATIKLQSTNPLGNRDRVIANLNQLRRAVRTAADTPINQTFFIEPIVMQALLLLPPRDPIHTPINEIGHRGPPWATRRRALLSEFETSESPMAA